MPLALLNLGPWEIALILVLALLLFGGKKLPALAKDLGSGIKEFRRSLSSSSEEDSVQQTPPPVQVESVPPPSQEVKETPKKTKKKA